MKKYLIILLWLGLVSQTDAQLVITGTANWVSSGNVSVVVQDLNLVNNGSIAAGSGSFKFTGTKNSFISGNSLSLFSTLEISKTNNAKVLLTRNISAGSLISFISGQLDLNGSNLLMGSTANIAGETETNRIIGGGFVEITKNLDSPNGSNPGNFGAIITTSSNLGSVTIRRGHLLQSGTGLTTSIRRYYSIIPQNNSNLNATLRLKYFDAELNGQVENSLVIYQSNNNGTNWNNLSQTTRNTNNNYVEKTGVASLSLQTLANNNVVVVDGVTGLVFTGERKKSNEVKLNWTSQTETNMNGYEVQRKLNNEVNFSPRAFVNSSAPGGNSLSPRSYQNKDANSHKGISYYRLKIVTLNGSFTYSNVIAVEGKNKTMNDRDADDTEITTATSAKAIGQTNTLTKKVTVGPNPNNGNFFFSVNGIEKETIATLYTIDGKQIKQFKVVNLQQQKVNGIPTGLYLLKIPGFETQKIIVNGDGNIAPQSIQSNNNKF